MKVVINIYDVQPSCNQKGADFFGVGIYHSGVEINGQEWSFGGNTMIRSTGVYACYPKQNMNFFFKTSIDLGEIPAKEFLEAEAARKSSSTSYGKNQRSSTVSSRSLNYHMDIMGVVDDLKE